MPSPDYQDRLALLLAKMGHSDLLRLRDYANPSGDLQNLLAPYEHRAFAREWVGEDPIMAPIRAMSVGVAAPLYQAGKALSPSNLGARTPPSLEELIQAYKGIGEGLFDGR